MMRIFKLGTHFLNKKLNHFITTLISIKEKRKHINENETKQNNWN
jgi:hypothetical protein